MSRENREDFQETPKTGRSTVPGWFAANPIAANLLMLLIFLGGLLGLSGIDKESYPGMNPGKIQIEAAYPGASPAEVESAVCIPIENAVHDLRGIKYMGSEAKEGQCQTMVQTQDGASVQELIGGIRTRTQAIPNLPKTVERIDVQPASQDRWAIDVTLYGPADPFLIKRLAETIEDDLAALPGVARLSPYSTRPYEISVEISQDRLYRHKLSLDEVAAAIGKSSLDLPGGAIKATAGELLLRAKGRAEDAAALAQLALRTLPDGSVLRLGDIATVKDGLQERIFEHRFDGYATEGWTVLADHDVVAVAERVKSYIAEQNRHLPAGVKLATWWDESRAFSQRFDTLMEDGLSGLCLVFAVLLLFLETRIAFWAAVGIFTSILGALWWMPVLGVSLNMMSLFGFLLAMGILVDDAIIIGESIHRRHTLGAGPEAAIGGVEEVILPVILAVSIVLVTFLPGLFLSNGWLTGLIKPVCIVMILTLAFSLVEALLILPAHLAAPPRADRTGWLARLQNALNRWLDRFVERRYRPALELALRHRYATLAAFVAGMTLIASLVAGGYVRTSLMADVAFDNFEVRLVLPPGAPAAEVKALAAQVERALFEVRAELDRLQPQGAASAISHVETVVRDNEVHFWIEIADHIRERLSVDEAVRAWRDKIGDIGRAKIDFLYRQSSDTYDLGIDLSAGDATTLMDAVAELKRKLAAYPGVYDIGDSSEPGKPEIRYMPKPEAIRLGLRLKDIAEQVRQGFHGEEAQRYLRGHGEVKVMVRYPESDRQSLDRLRLMPVKLPDGGHAPLGALAEVSYAQGYAKLTRENRRRVLQVRAKIDKRIADANAIYADLDNDALRSLERRFPGTRAQVGKERAEQEAMLASLWRNTLLALVAVYALIAIPFRSYLLPLVFLMAAPVAWSGAVVAHWLLGLPLSMESLVGMIAASGVVVNDSLVLLDYVRRREGSDESAERLLGEACSVRFRPILLAFLTNFAGFFPTLMEKSAQAQFLVPMTLSLAAGLLFGMGACLFLTPAGYAAAEDVRRLAERIRQRRAARAAG